MANVVTTDYFREQVISGNVNLSGDSFAVAFMNNHVHSATEASLKAVHMWSEVSAYEASAVGYSATPLTATTISANSSNVVFWDGTDITWSSITLSPYGLVIYRISDGLIVGFIEFTSQQVAVNGSITVSWNVAGIMNVF